MLTNLILFFRKLEQRKVSARINIGTRGSPLALAQAGEVKAGLVAAHSSLGEDDIEIIIIKTSGDIITDRRLIEEGGKGLFTKEIEEQLLAGDIDLAVHSTKDMPAKLPRGLEIGAFLKREDPRDAFLSPVAKSLKDLPKGAVVGTSSLRRQAQVLKARPDLEVIPFRGNVGTRLRKLKSGEVAATLLAVAGLNRLGLEDEITSYLEFDEMLPAPGQGAVAIETRAGDDKTAGLLSPINHIETGLCARVERAVSLGLGASCRMPLGALAVVSGDRITVTATLFSPDGRNFWNEKRTGPVSDPEGLGSALAAAIKAQADPKILEAYKIF